MNNGFSVDSHNDGRTVYVHLSGEFDINGIEVFNEEMDLVKQSRADQVVIDLSRLSFMDSSGIRTLLRIHHEYDHTGGMLVSIVPGPPNVMRVLEIAGVDTRLNFYSSNGSAVSPSAKQTP